MRVEMNIFTTIDDVGRSIPKKFVSARVIFLTRLPCVGEVVTTADNQDFIVFLSCHVESGTDSISVTEDGE